MATTLKELLDSLTAPDKARLMYAFENELSQFATLPDGRFIGVNTDANKQLEPDFNLSRGVWRVGYFKSRIHAR